MKRRETRDAMMKLLYQMDIHNELDTTEHFEVLKLQIKGAREIAYGENIIASFIANRKEIDQRIEDYSNNWKLDRLSKVDLAILRLAIVEICYIEDIPDPVAANEAVELAKEYSSEESYSFINGILSRVIKEK